MRFLISVLLLGLLARPWPVVHAARAVRPVKTTAVEVRAEEPPAEPSYPDIAANDEPTPRLNGPRVVGTTPGREFIYRLPVTGAPPLTCTVTNLPPGLTFDAATGVIRGRVEKEV